MTEQRKLLLSAAVLLFGVAFICPPTEKKIQPVFIGATKLSDSAVIATGFTFVGAIDGPVSIRYTQWIVELVVLGSLVLAIVRTAPRATVQ